MRLYYSHFSGVTLLEMLAVISIILVLSSVVMISVANVSEGAQRAKAERNAALLNTAIEQYSSMGGDLSAALSEGNPVSAVINSLRSSQPAAIRMGGPFIDSGKGPIMSSDGWRVYLSSRVVQTNARVQIFFEITNSAGVSGIEGFTPMAEPTGFIPIGLMSLDSTNIMSSGAPVLTNRAVIPAGPPAGTWSSSSASFY